MTVLDERARDATAGLWDAVNPDVETMLVALHEQAQRRRQLRAGLVAVAAAALLLAVAVVLPDGSGSRTDLPAGPTHYPTGEQSPSHSPRVLVRAEPLCELDWQIDSAYGEPLWNGPVTCPASTPAGEYASMVSGLHVVRPFTVRIPDGWVVTTVPHGFWQVVDVRARDRSAGLTLVTYVAPMTAKNLVSRASLTRWLRRNPDLRVAGQREEWVGGQSVWRADVSLRDGAAVGAGCRLLAPCRPLLTTALKFAEEEPAAHAVELRPGVTGRLFLPETGNAGYGVWLWDTGPGTRQDQARQVLASLHVYHVRDPKPVPSPTS
jgi:hypothetical protein